MTVSVAFIEYDGTRREIDGQEGSSAMEVASNNGVPGIDAECGGACACATCHVYVGEEWINELDPPSDNELSMLEFAANRQENSRLSCQIKLSPKISGIELTTPEFQF
ncbi:2Fe-2S ferredoxin [Salipiger aestuarii]|jgi:ferredoxin, 2Fe-2S|uniref:2Fe-2S ferredoxin n=1 Tax=Salipiger aestuarii TaxID=568098 RepID=A0A327YDF0_9RHOB|nr:MULTISPECIES: 2Fe-2S iron-sulfur cluster-binding protein [Rhodobacterales]EIE49959.1 ferredoxin [Citreicella sp. 357]KAA8605744.1 2Fe-2S ferredoxin [Salipiger aestuarii]KAA8612173.1 2Fe-2S ferredoxin [Salipiger aestuarii]KAB2539903.1 2Fe-2S ferredoxin [Salipiger aestuarii]KMK64101.1 ferredoxin [Puniceibacterium sp. IMCC21224]